MTYHRPSSRYYLVAGVALVLLVLNVYITKTLVIFGSPVLFLAAIFFEIVMLGVLAYAIIRVFLTPSNVVKSILLSLWGGLKSNEYIQQIMRSDSPVVRWGRRRLNIDSPFGLLLTGVVVIALIPLFNFFGVMLTVLNHGLLTQVDTRTLNLMPMVRTSGETAFFSMVTVLANFQDVLLLAAIAIVLLWRSRQRIIAGVVLAAVISEEGVAYVVKHLVARARPDTVLSLINEDSFSFPSGHVMRATVIFGLLTYLLLKTLRSTAARVVAVGIYLLAVLLVALSRIYLGVHYPSDVWASALIGSTILIVLVGFLEAASRFELFSGRKLSVGNRGLLIIPIVALVFAFVASPLLVHPQVRTTRFTPRSLSTLDETTIKQFPLYSETLTGSRMEPINFVYVGSEEHVLQTFEQHGWTKADPSTLSNTLRALAVGFQGGQYPNAPVTPSFLNSKPESVAFQKATATQSLRQRHHTRLWRTDYVTADGLPIWAATASFDDGIEFAGPAKLPTHHIDPNIDAERAYIIESLGYPTHLLTITQPEIGKNASGDNFFTDGKAELIQLP